MKRNILLALLLFSFLLSGCGGSSSATADRAPAESSAVSMESAKDSLEYGGLTMSDSSTSSSLAGGSIYADENAKVIRTASFYLQSTQFDDAVAALNALVEAQGGYFEDASVNSGSYYSTSRSRYGYYTVRIPKANFDAFLSEVGNVAHIVDHSIKSQDVGEAYYDAELRLETLKTKHERLLALLEQATIMEDIITLESALSEVEYEIQQYTSTLDRYDGLIDFSTITIELQEVVRVTDDTDERDGLGTRLAGAFSEGWLNFCDGMADFVVWVAYHFIGCIIFAAVVAVVVIIIVKRRSRTHASVKNAPPATPPDDHNA